MLGSSASSISRPSVEEESLSRVYSPSSSFLGAVSSYSAAGNPRPATDSPTSASVATPNTMPPATTSAPTVIPTISPVRFFRGGGGPCGKPNGCGGPCGYPKGCGPGADCGPYGACCPYGACGAYGVCGGPYGLLCGGCGGGPYGPCGAPYGPCGGCGGVVMAPKLRHAGEHDFETVVLGRLARVAYGRTLGRPVSARSIPAAG